jgi:hypothetical protein
MTRVFTVDDLLRMRMDRDGIMFGHPEPIFDNTQKLEDTGTRYQHYRDLVELWESGLAVLKRYINQYDKEGLLRIAKLEHAIEMTNRQIETMANFGGKRSSLMFEIDNIPYKNFLTPN